MLLLAACATAPPPPVPPPAPATAPGQPRPYRVGRTWYKPMNDARGFSQTGIASWYGREFHGKRTSSGETYDMYAMTAAHKTLPLGTWVRVRHRDSGRDVVVRVNDRGPFVHGRIIDLSYAAAKELGIVGPGTGPVDIVALGERRQTAGGTAYTPVDYYNGTFTFQVGAFSDRTNAERLRTRLEQSFTNAHITAFDRGDMVFYRVRVGRCSDLETATQYEQYLADSGYPDAFIVAE